MYNLGIHLYALGVAVASHFNKKVSKMWRGEHDTFRILKEKADPNSQYIWVHAASLGEFEQGRPIIERIKQDHPEQKVLLTFFSPSGYEVRKNYSGADIICYLPLDTKGNARRFLSLINVKMAFFIKYEFWYNYLHILRHRGVPTYSVSSIFRPGQIFFRWYGRQYGRVLKCFTKFFVQNEVSRELLATIGIHRVEITGDTRFDRVLQIKDAAKQLPLVESFVSPVASEAAAQRKCFIVGSSWEPDEDIYIPYFTDKDWKLIIATHVVSPERVGLLKKRLVEQGKKVVLYSEADKPEVKGTLSEADVMIIDCYGLLSSIYRYADVAYVGGGFGVGIHNLPEAAVWGVPVFFGPNNARFQEAQDLKQNGGGLEITNSHDFEQLMNDLVAHPDAIKERGRQAGSYVMNRSGATDKILRSVEWAE